jgi:hypothetical protein
VPRCLAPPGPKKPTDRHAPLWGATLPNPTPCPAHRPYGGTGCRDGSKSYTLVTSSSLENSITHQRLPVKALEGEWENGMGFVRLFWAGLSSSALGWEWCDELGHGARGTVVLSWPSPVAESGTASGAAAIALSQRCGPQGPRTRAPGPSSRPQQPAGSTTNSSYSTRPSARSTRALTSNKSGLVACAVDT